MVDWLVYAFGIIGRGVNTLVYLRIKNLFLKYFTLPVNVFPDPTNKATNKHKPEIRKPTGFRLTLRQICRQERSCLRFYQ